VSGESCRLVTFEDSDVVVAALAAGSVVAVPTDTVYGLAARPDHPAAVAAVFDAKHRPPELALPVLVADESQLDGVVVAWPPVAHRLAERLWPGGLTVVVTARPALARLLGGDGRTIGVRLPDHEELRGLLRRTGPLAVTSANRHGVPPCTTAEAVRLAFADEPVDLVVDGGTCDGAPSTVVDVTVDPPRLVREGALPWTRILGACA